MDDKATTPQQVFKEQKRWSSRKFMLTVSIIVLATLLLLVKAITGDIWSTMVGTVTLGYFAGNIGEDAVVKWGSKGK